MRETPHYVFGSPNSSWCNCTSLLDTGQEFWLCSIPPTGNDRLQIETNTGELILLLWTWGNKLIPSALTHGHYHTPLCMLEVNAYKCHIEIFQTCVLVTSSKDTDVALQVISETSADKFVGFFFLSQAVQGQAFHRQRLCKDQNL